VPTLEIAMVDVLLLHDDPAVRHCVAEVLVDGGLSVIDARDGEEASSLLASAQPRVVLLALTCPVTGSAEFFRSLSALGDTTPLLLLTYGAVRDEARDAEAQVPVDADGLLEQVETLLPFIGRSEGSAETAD
jgi:DNA-binding response OmpR family regulator